MSSSSSPHICCLFLMTTNWQLCQEKWKGRSFYENCNQAWGSKILWFSCLLGGNLPSSKDKNQSILLPQTLTAAYVEDDFPADVFFQFLKLCKIDRIKVYSYLLHISSFALSGRMLESIHSLCLDRNIIVIFTWNLDKFITNGKVKSREFLSFQLAYRP